MSTPRRPGAFRGGIDGVLLVAVLLVAVNLRAPLTAVPPVVAEVAADLGLTAATAGLLTGIPVLCFALATPAVAGLLGRSSLRTAVAVALVLVLAGTVLRSLDLSGVAPGGHLGTFAGTVLIGLGITTANLSVPMIAQRDFPGHVSTVTGLYTAAINVGTVVTTALTAPLAGAVGWRWALASWGLLAVVALAWWWRVVPPEPARARPPRAGRRRRADTADTDAATDGLAEGMARGVTGTEPAAARERHVLATPFTWALCLMFALQSSSFYALTAWLPLVLEDLAGVPRSAAGGAASLFQASPSSAVSPSRSPCAGCRCARRSRASPRSGCSCPPGCSWRPAPGSCGCPRPGSPRRRTSSSCSRSSRTGSRRCAAAARRRRRSSRSATRSPPSPRRRRVRCRRRRAPGRRRSPSCSAASRS
ncbi:CynX/NimT family MFS transporter [Cellulosimicrobium sp. CUA-896]|uniref:MFS transporter n=1 Tax=Cellulosimicrobium sp. CUA-896 TaxID=1517881 RepID=UPI002100C128|nr:MFS transporter [Cellulosimicrobium sp. CUA-896]